MDQTRPLSGALNLDDAIEAVGPEDFISAKNLVSSKNASQQKGSRERINGTTEIATGSLLFAEEWTNNLNGWQNKVQILADPASLSFTAVSTIGVRNFISGTASMVFASAATPVTYNVTIRARIAATVAINTVKFLYRLGGSGAYSVLKTTTVGVQPSYSFIETILTIPKGTLLEMYCTNISDQSIQFGTGNGGPYSGNGGPGSPLSENINSAADRYININVISNQFVVV